MLSWPVFEDQSANLDLKSLLLNHNSGIPLNPIVSDFETAPEDHLVQKFMDHVFIFNPVLEEAKVHRYVRDARYNGITWDSQSCLLVSDGSSTIQDTDLIATHLRSWCSGRSYGIKTILECIRSSRSNVFSAGRIILLCSPEANGPASMSEWRHRSPMLLPRRSVSDDHHSSAGKSSSPFTIPPDLSNSRLAYSLLQ